MLTLEFVGLKNYIPFLTRYLPDIVGISLWIVTKSLLSPQGVIPFLLYALRNDIVKKG